MTVQLGDKGGIELSGVCDVGDAETLLRLLLAEPGAKVDWRACESVHAAVLQVILAAKVTPTGPPQGRFVIDMLEPLLKRR